MAENRTRQLLQQLSDRHPDRVRNLFGSYGWRISSGGQTVIVSDFELSPVLTDLIFDLLGESNIGFDFYNHKHKATLWFRERCFEVRGECLFHSLAEAYLALTGGKK